MASTPTTDPMAGWDAARVNAEAPGNPLEQLADVVLSRILSRVGTRTVFGEPVTQGDITVVPVAKVSTRFGFGGGSGSSPAKQDADASNGSGMGGGGDVKAKPLGYIEITPHGSRFMPIEDEMEIGVLAMKFVGVAIVLVALRFLLRRGGLRQAAESDAAAHAEQSGKRWRRKATSVPWGRLATVAAAASRVQARARKAA